MTLAIEEGIPRRGDRMKRHIETGLALAIAGQVSAGLAPGDEEGPRARLALIAISLMLRTATENDEMIVAALSMAENTKVTMLDHGAGWRIEYTK